MSHVGAPLIAAGWKSYPRRPLAMTSCVSGDGDRICVGSGAGGSRYCFKLGVLHNGWAITLANLSSCISRERSDLRCALVAVDFVLSASAPGELKTRRVGGCAGGRDLELEGVRASERAQRALHIDYKLPGLNSNRHTQSFDSVHNTTMKFLVSYIPHLSPIDSIV